MAARCFKCGSETFGTHLEVSIGMGYPIVFISFLAFLILMAGVIVSFAMFFRYKKRELQHRERLIALEKGVALPADGSPDRQLPPWTPRIFLLRGLIWLFTGISAVVFLLCLSLASRHERAAWVRVTQATSAKQNGATEDQVRQIMNDKEERELPTGVSLIGLVPMGIGLAYLITFRAERSAGYPPKP
jgi:hypothetical protein